MTRLLREPAERLRLALEAVVGSGELTRLLTEPADKLLSEIERLNLVTLAIAEKLAHFHAVGMKATDLAKFGKAVADALLTTAKIRQQSSQGSSTKLPGVPGDTAKIKLDELDPAWDAFRKEIARMNAEVCCMGCATSKAATAPG